MIQRNKPSIEHKNGAHFFVG